MIKSILSLSNEILLSDFFWKNERELLNGFPQGRERERERVPLIGNLDGQRCSRVAITMVQCQKASYRTASNRTLLIRLLDHPGSSRNPGPGCNRNARSSTGSSIAANNELRRTFRWLSGCSFGRKR